MPYSAATRAEKQREANKRHIAAHREEINARRREKAAVERAKCWWKSPEAVANRKAEVAERAKLSERRRRKARLERMKVEEPTRYRELMKKKGATREAGRSEAYRDRKADWRVVWQREYRKDPAVRLGKQLRDRLRSALSGRVKSGSAVGLLGCSIDEAKRLLERQFQRGMTWENWGERWEIDHVRPLIGFDLADPEQLAQACHITNLRPLPKLENRSKGGRREFLL